MDVLKILRRLHLVFLFCFTFLSPFKCYSQNSASVIKGRIVDAGGYPQTDVVLKLKKLGNVATTDKKGFFHFEKLPAIHDTLIILSTDYKGFIIGIILHDGQVLDMGTINPALKANQLQDVEINGRRANSYKSDYSFFGNKTETPLVDLPQAISTVTSQLIKDQMDFSLKDAMNDVAGANQYSGFDEYTIRGFRAENARDINGLRGYNTTYTSAMLVNIDRVEVIKGPTATLYGNCDPGGTINMVTKKPLSDHQASADLYFGTWNHFRTQADVTGPLNSTKTLLYRLNVGYDQTKSFQNQFYAKSYELAPSFSFVPNQKLRLNVDFSVSHINSMLNNGQPGVDGDGNLLSTPISLTLTQPGDYLNETDVASNVNASYKITKALTFNIGYLNYITQQGVASHGLNDYITPDSVSLYYTAWNYHTVTNTISSYFTWKLNPAKVSQQFVAGYDYIRSSVTLNQRYYELPGQFGSGSGIVGTMSLKNPQYDARAVNSYEVSDFDSDANDVDGNVYHTQGVYVQDEISYKRFRALLSLRGEFYKGGDTTGGIMENVFLPRIGFVYSLTQHINAYANWNNGFDPFEASAGTQVYNAPFKPQKSRIYEAGLKGDFLENKLSATVAVYQLTVQNVAVNANVISDPNLFVQQGENRSRGVELETSGNILPNLSVKLSYAYCNAIVSKTDIASQAGLPVANAPLNSSGSWVNYTIPNGVLKGFGFSIGHTAVSKRFTLDPSTTLPGYFILNGGVHYSRRHYHIGANLYNITNQTYWTGAYNNVNKWPGGPRNGLADFGYVF